MSERHMGYVVELGSDVGEEESREIVAALKMIRGVARVSPVEATFEASVIAGHRRDDSWRNRLLELMQEMRDR